MMGEASEAAVALLHAAGEDGGAAAGGCRASGSTGSSASSGIGTASSGWSSSLFSSTTTWSVGDEEEDGDGATSSFRPPPADRRRRVSSFSSLSSLSSTSSESEAVQVNGAAAGGPLYEMSTMRDHLPRSRTGLSMYYQGRSESFASLADVRCVEDLAKKTTPYIRRPKASGHHTAALGLKNRLSKTIAKKEPRGRKPLATSECQGKKELYRC